MRYLLDTNILSDLVRNPQGRIMERIARIGDDKICTSIVVSAELRYGAAKKRSPRLTTQLEAVLSTLDILAFEAPADAVYAEVRAKLEGVGRPIGANDLLIAAHGLANGCVVVTDNESEFCRVEGLTVENWLR